MGWQDDARRLVKSERYDLESFTGYWIKAKKYSIADRDTIQAALREVQKGIDKKALVDVMRKAKNLSMGENYTEQELKDKLMENLSNDDFAALMESTGVSTAKVIEAKLRSGIAEHNFDGTTVEELAHSLLEYPQICEEALKFVEKFNAPLASQTPKISGTSQSGSTTQPSSTMEMSCQTEGNLPS